MNLYWREQALCNGQDVKYFTLGVKDDGVSRDWLTRTADQYCSICPVKQDCLDSATYEDLQHTLRGGLIPSSNKKTPEEFPSVDVEVAKYVAKGKCARRRKPHRIVRAKDVLVYLDSGRSKGFRLRCSFCQEEAAAKYASAKRGTIDA
jgi:hypothetical protein